MGKIAIPLTKVRRPVSPAETMGTVALPWAHCGSRAGRARDLGRCRLSDRVLPPEADLREDFLVVLAERGRRRVDARAAMRKGEGGERHAEAALDAGRGGMAVDDAAARELRI